MADDEEGHVEEVLKEGTWECPNCSSENRGRDVKCGSCGQSRETVEFKYDETSAAVTEADQVATARGGPDWVCGFCSTSNRSSAGKCGQCGGARTEGKAREVKDVPPRMMPKPPVAAAVEGATAPGWTRTVLGVLAALMAIFAGCFCVSFDKTVTLATAHWDRSIAIEKLMPVVEEDWQVPTGGKIMSSWSAVHHHDRVQTGTEQVDERYTEKVKTGTKNVKTGTKNMGNGYFKEIWETKAVYENVTKTRRVSRPVYTQVPRYQTKYKYEIMKWVKVRDVNTTGADLTPVWGTVELASGEREGPRSSSRQIKLTAGAKSYDFAPEEPQFMRLKIGGSYVAEITMAGEVKALKEK